jgi:hypothetical protein
MGIAWGNIQEISVFQQGRDSKGLKKYFDDFDVSKFFIYCEKTFGHFYRGW